MRRAENHRVDHGRTAVLLAGALALLVACEEPSSTEETTSSPDTETETVLPPASVTHLVVVDTMGFTRQLEPGVAPGFNLDGRVSEEGDEATCGKEDQIGPDGTPGIDNALAILAPAFELFGIGAAEELIQGAIDDGGLLILFQIDGVDSLVDDDEITLTLRTAQGVPLLGTDGLLLSGQTFSLHPESPDSALTGSIESGVLLAGPGTARLPIVVFGISYELTIAAGLIRADITENGGLNAGLFGGSVSVADLQAIGETAAMDDPSVLPAIEAVFFGATDMDLRDDGQCHAISGTFAFTAVSAFLFNDE